MERKPNPKAGSGESFPGAEGTGGCISWGDSAEAALEGKELAESINRFVKALEQTEGRIFVLRYWHLYSIREIARKYHFSESKVKSMLSRTRGKLQKYLKKEGVL